MAAAVRYGDERGKRTRPQAEFAVGMEFGMRSVQGVHYSYK